MTDILVPAEPADLIDRIVGLRLRIDTTDDPVLQTELRRKHALLLRLADRLMPADAMLQDLIHQLEDARRDLRALVSDLQACDSRKDYGVGFVALSQAMLAAMISAEEARAGINLCFARLGEAPVEDILREP